MNTALKWKLIAGFLLVFLAGGVTGAFVAAAKTRHFLLMPPNHGMAAETMRRHLRAQLNLTPEQMTKISPIIDRAGAQLEEIRLETGRRVHETFAEANKEMAGELTDAQRAKLEQMRHRHPRWLHRRHRPDEPNPTGTPQP